MTEQDLFPGVILEKQIVKKILKWLLTIEGCEARKVHGSRFSPGEPDIDACIRGRAIKIEVKRGGNKPSPLQLQRLKKWKGAGAVTGVAYSLEDAKHILEEEGFYE